MVYGYMRVSSDKQTFDFVPQIVVIWSEKYFCLYKWDGIFIPINPCTDWTYFSTLASTKSKTLSWYCSSGNNADLIIQGQLNVNGSTYSYCAIG